MSSEHLNDAVRPAFAPWFQSVIVRSKTLLLVDDYVRFLKQVWRYIHLQELSIHLRQRHCGHHPEGSSNRKSLFVKGKRPPYVYKKFIGSMIYG